FQAEDGIRDFHVTGVQTCALPILETHMRKSVTYIMLFIGTILLSACNEDIQPTEALYQAIGMEKVALTDATYEQIAPHVAQCERSEERRVGKESRTRRRLKHHKRE